MKIRTFGWLIALAIATSPVFADQYEIRAVGDFYQPLSQYGYWVQHPEFGWCWRPDRVVAEWRPYADGRWLRTADGWYWDSDEPWAWACYHYGRWFTDARHGWLWQPGTEWASAWVDWRESDDYVGWAPVPPRYSIVYTEQIIIAPTTYVFVERRHFCEPVRPVIIERRHCDEVYRHTRGTNRPRYDRDEVSTPVPTPTRPPQNRRDVTIPNTERREKPERRDRREVVIPKVERQDPPAPVEKPKVVVQPRPTPSPKKDVNVSTPPADSKRIYDSRIPDYLKDREQRRHKDKDD